MSSTWQPWSRTCHSAAGDVLQHDSRVCLDIWYVKQSLKQLSLAYNLHWVITIYLISSTTCPVSSCIISIDSESKVKVSSVEIPENGRIDIIATFSSLTETVDKTLKVYAKSDSGEACAVYSILARQVYEDGLMLI